MEEERQERIRVAQEQERLRQLEEQRARLEEEQRRLAAAQANMHAHQHTPDRVMPSTPGQYASPQRTIPVLRIINVYFCALLYELYRTLQ